MKEFTRVTTMGDDLTYMGTNEVKTFNILTFRPRKKERNLTF
jgi:hypothetical protein